MTGKPWDRRDDETDPAWVAFVAYRDAGQNRSMSQATAAVGKGPAMKRQLEGWSSKHEWVKRVRAFDSWIDQEHQRRVRAQSLDRRSRQAALGRNLQAAAGAGLQRYFKTVKDPTAPGGERLELQRDLKPTEVAALAKAGFEIEAVSEGEPSQRMAVDGAGLEVRLVDVKSLPDARAVGPVRPGQPPTLTPDKKKGAPP
jgi:hypothetical protein